MSKDCSSGTPAFIMVASWRVKSVMSLSRDLAAAADPLLLDLGDHDALAAQRRVDHRLAAARISPRMILPALSLPSQSEGEFLRPLGVPLLPLP